MSEKKYLAVDIGGTAAKLGIWDELGNVGAAKSYSVNFDSYETPILKTVKKCCGEFLKETGEQICGIGVSATGAINTKDGTVAGTAGHIKNWKGSRIKEELELEFQVPVFVLNDANAAALGEMWLGAARKTQQAVVLTIGTGVGGGIIVDSHILLGANGFAGELGHCTIAWDAKPCSCKNKGCLEQYGSMTALIRMVKEAVTAGELPGICEENVTGKYIFDEIAAQNKAMEQIADRWMEYLAAGIVGMVHIFNPQIVILGGGVCAQEELFIEKIRKKVKERVMPHFAQGLEIVAAELGNKAGMAGAVYYCMQQEKQI